MRRLLRALVLAEVIALLPLAAAMPASLPHGQFCADRVAHALSSPRAIVPGSYACLSPNMQSLATRLGYDGDAGLQRLAADRGRDQSVALGQSADGGFLFEFSGSGTSNQLMVLWIDPDGLVFRIDSDDAP